MSEPHNDSSLNSSSYEKQKDEEWSNHQNLCHNKYLSLVDRFEPDQNDMILFNDDPKWQRLIFPPYEGYKDMEEEKYEEFKQYLDEEGIDVPDWITKRMLLRVLEGEEFKNEQAGKKLQDHLKWRDETLPITLNDHMKELIVDLGLYYTHGRDKSLRPITFFQPRVVVGRHVILEESLLGCHFVAQHIIENMMEVGKVENWVNVLDLARLGVTSLPRNWIVAFIKSFSNNTYARTKCMYMVNSGTAVSIVWNIVRVFVHWTVKQKMIFSSSNTHKSLQECCHPSQLQKSYGGEAEDVEYYWPPYYPSDEFGVDPKKLKHKDEYDATLIMDDPVEMPENFKDTKLLAGVTSKIDEVKVEDIKVDHKSSRRLASDAKKRGDASKVKKGKGGCCNIF